MRIVICDYAGHPFQVELSRTLAHRGHSVLHLHFADLQAPKGELAVAPGDSPNFQVEGIRTGAPFDKSRFFRRRFLEAKVGTRMAWRAMAFAPDIVVGCNMPLDAQKKLRRAAAARDVPFVFWLQDLVSIATGHFLGEKLGAAGRAIGRHYMRLEAKLLRSSEAIIPISDKFLAPLAQWGIEAGKVRVIPNWAPLSEIRPGEKKNAWARQHGLGGKLVALYTGTLGLKHDPSLLLEAARAGAPLGIEVVVVSEGRGADWLQQRRRETGLQNLKLLPFQPMELYSEVLAASDILLAMIEREAAGFSVPSKILSYLAAGRPIVASIAADNDAAATIREAQAGLVVEPGDTAAFTAAVLQLITDDEQRRRLGRNARLFAERAFDVVGKAIAFEETFASISRPRAQRASATPPAGATPAPSANA